MSSPDQIKPILPNESKDLNIIPVIKFIAIKRTDVEILSSLPMHLSTRNWVYAQAFIVNISCDL